MARYRTVKPEFWTSEQVVECSTNARLLFVGMWNFADDGGAMKASAKTLKMQVFPADDFTVDDIQGMVDELKANNLIAEYEHENTRYWWVTGWHHQRIDRPSYKFPSPLNPHDTVEISTNARRTLDESSSNGSRALDYGKEGKGKEGNKKDANASLSPAPADDDSKPPPGTPVKTRSPIPICPAQKIVGLYNRICTSLPSAKYESWSGTNQKRLRDRWKWLMSRPVRGDDSGRTYADDADAALGWWEAFFRFVQDECPHLIGENDRGWSASLLWLIRPENFDKVKQGDYRRVPARVSR